MDEEQKIASELASIEELMIRYYEGLRLNGINRPNQRTNMDLFKKLSSQRRQEIIKSMEVQCALFESIKSKNPYLIRGF